MKATVMLETLDGQWEQLGVDRLRGVHPEGLVATANRKGPDAASFALRRRPAAVHPDLSAFTPCVIELGSVPIWSGRVWETPGTEGNDEVVSVQGRGWQYHLDDDAYERVYVHTRLADWKDTRGLANAPLALFTQKGRVDSGSAISMGWPAGTTIPNLERAGVTLDLGPDQRAKRIVIHFNTLAPFSGFRIRAHSHDTEDPTTGNLDVGIDQAMTVSSPQPGSFTTGYRYVSIFLFANGAQGPTAGDTLLRLLRVQVFTDTAYESANESVLKADTVVKDALDQATILLSDDRTRVAEADFAIPDLAVDGQTPGQAIDAVNAYQGWDTGVDVHRRPVFEPLKALPELEIGVWPGSTFNDAAANSGEEIVSRVLVKGTGPDGQPLTVQRTQPPDFRIKSPDASFPNPSFVTDLASWSASEGATIARDINIFDTTPASLSCTDAGGGAVKGVAQTTLSGTLRAGKTYTVRLALRRDHSSINSFTLHLAGSQYALNASAVPLNAFGTVQFDYTPTIDRVNPVFLVEAIAGSGGVNQLLFHLDSCELQEGAGTLVQRRGFVRTRTLPVSAPLTALIGQRLGDVWLAGHKTTPLRGTAQVEVGGCRRVVTGDSVHPGHLLLHTSEPLLLSDRADPDTGAWGRTGIIDAVTYTHDNENASVALDNDRRRLDQLVARYSAVVGSGA